MLVVCHGTACAASRRVVERNCDAQLDIDRLSAEIKYRTDLNLIGGNPIESIRYASILAMPSPEIARTRFCA